MFPSGQDLVGKLVKVSNGRERFWVEITGVMKGLNDVVYSARVDNKLVDSDQYNCDDIIYILGEQIDTRVQPL